MKKPIAETETEVLERELTRSKRILSSPDNLLPKSVTFFKRRRDLIQAEIEKRAAAGV